MTLFLGELKRKKNKNIKSDFEPCDQVNVLVDFWKLSLTSDKILSKLKIKQTQSFQQPRAGRETNASSLHCSRLSDKEIYLLHYLEGTEKSQLLQLGKDSTTRNYGELATIPEAKLREHIASYLGLEALDRSGFNGDKCSYHMPQPSI